MKIVYVFLAFTMLAFCACSGKQGQAKKTAGISGGESADAASGEQPPPASLPDYIRDSDIGPRTEHGRIEKGKPPEPGSSGGVLGILKSKSAAGMLIGIGTVITTLKEKWKNTIGYTTYKSTIHFFDGKIIVNSNGSSWKDKSDGQDGVYIIDPKTGNVMKQIVPPGGDEKDCNGIALTKDAIFFGTDQDAIYKMDWKGKVIWKTKVKGDVEAAPALSDFNGDKVLDAAVGSEGGIFYALDGKKGKVLWKITAGKSYYGATGFLGAPALYDATGDGIDDVFVPCRDEFFRVINGKSGKLIWKHKGTSSMHGAPIIVDADGDGKMEVVFTECYSDVYCADAKTGAIKWSATLKNPDGGIEGLFSPVGWYPDAGCVIVATAWWKQNEGVYCLSGKNGSKKWRFTKGKQNITSGAVIGDVDGNPGAEVVFGTEAGEIVALDKTGRLVIEHKVGGPVECTPTLADIDGDGNIEIIAAANNGSLYLLETPGKAPAVIEYHRGSPKNDGNL